jgi:hypothetical protein
MSLNFYKILIIFLLVVFATFGQTTYAQTANDIYADVVPENPAPGEGVDITLSSYLLDLNASKITWIVGGKSVLSGVGQKSYSLNAPTAGAETIVTIRIASTGGDIETKVSIRPSVMVMLWQADDSYVPPFYKGKALPTPDSTIKIVAMPEIKTGSTYVNPKNMTYSWRQDYTNDQEASGYGKSSFSYISDYLDPANYIEVIATTIDQKYSSTSAVNVATFKPKLLFYKNDEKLGTVFENALADGHRITDKEIIFAAPYFISPGDIRIPRLTWEWSINGERVETGFPKNMIPLQVQSGVSGTSRLKLYIESMDKIFETAEGELQLEF